VVGGQVVSRFYAHDLFALLMTLRAAAFLLPVFLNLLAMFLFISTH
jgi:hypothetical protein